MWESGRETRRAGKKFVGTHKGGESYILRDSKEVDAS